MERLLIERAAPAIAKVLYVLDSVVVPELVRLLTVMLGTGMVAFIFTMSLPFGALPMFVAIAGWCIGFPARWIWLGWQATHGSHSMRELCQ